jgi:hypothetical protein
VKTNANKIGLPCAICESVTRAPLAVVSGTSGTAVLTSRSSLGGASRGSALCALVEVIAAIDTSNAAVAFTTKRL